jgi:hypothetical protein
LIDKKNQNKQNLATARDDVVSYFAAARVPMLDACALLAQRDPKLLFKLTNNDDNDDDDDGKQSAPVSSHDEFALLLGLAMEELSNAARRHDDAVRAI